MADDPITATRPEPDLAAFVYARLDEDESTATVAISAHERILRLTPCTSGGRWKHLNNDDYDGVEVTDGSGHEVVPNAAAGGWQRIHIARHDPARVLRQTAALRAETALHVPEPGQHPDFCGCDRHELPCPSLRRLAAIWAYHPDYRQEWAP